MLRNSPGHLAAGEIGSLAHRHDVGDIDQDPENGEGCGNRAADHQDPAHVPDHVPVLLCRAGGEQTLTGGTARPRWLITSGTITTARPARFRSAILGDDLGLELGGSSLLGSRQGARRPGVGA